MALLAGFETAGSSSSLSVSVSTNLLDLLMFDLVTGFAVADFLGTTFGGLLGSGFLAGLFFFLAAFVSASESSSLIGLGLTLVLVTKPDLTDFLTTGGFLFLSPD